MNNFIVRTITSVLFVAVIVCSFLEPVGMIALFALVTLLSVREFCSLINENVEKVQVNTFICTAAGTYFFLAMTGYVSELTPSAGIFVPYLITLIYLLIAELYLKAENPVMNWAYTMFSQMYVALPLSMISVLAFQGAGATGADMSAAEARPIAFTLTPLIVFIFLWLNDAGAYCTGSLIGRHKLFPRVSPGKSWEGSIGGGVLVLIAAAVIWLLTGQPSATMAQGGGKLCELIGGIPQLSLPEWLGMGLVVVVFGTWGDLIESLFKRTLGIKDSGNLLPGHGGMLDRFDSTILAMPAVVVYLYTLQLVA